MLIESRTILLRRGRAWVELISAKFLALNDPPMQEGKLLNSTTVEVEPGADFIVLSDRPLAKGYDLGQISSWPETRAVGFVSDDPLRASKPMRDELFWKIIQVSREAPSTWFVARESIRASLKALDSDDVLGFQLSFVEKSMSLVKRFGFSWATAGLAVLLGSESFRTVADGIASPNVVAAEPEFEDTTDIAEEVLGRTIYIEGFGTSRSSQRDATPMMPTGWLEHNPIRHLMLGVPKWEDAPARWASVRLRFQTSGELRESVVLVNRHFGMSVSAVVRKALDEVPGAGIDSLVGPIDYVDPHISGLMRSMAPVFYFRSTGKQSEREFLRSRGYSSSVD